jgi:hypothetical protein
MNDFILFSYSEIQNKNSLTLSGDLSIESKVYVTVFLCTA